MVTLYMPWADFSSRWILDLEFRGVETLLTCSSVETAAKLFNLSWPTLHSIMAEAVVRGLTARRRLENLHFPGLGEPERSGDSEPHIDGSRWQKSFLRGQTVSASAAILKGKCVLEVSPRQSGGSR